MRTLRRHEFDKSFWELNSGLIIPHQRVDISSTQYYQKNQRRQILMFWSSIHTLNLEFLVLTTLQLNSTTAYTTTTYSTTTNSTITYTTTTLQVHFISGMSFESASPKAPVEGKGLRWKQSHHTISSSPTTGNSSPEEGGQEWVCKRQIILWYSGYDFMNMYFYILNQIMIVNLDH